MGVDSVLDNFKRKLLNVLYFRRVFRGGPLTLATILNRYLENQQITPLENIQLLYCWRFYFVLWYYCIVNLTGDTKLNISNRKVLVEIFGTMWYITTF